MPIESVMVGCTIKIIWSAGWCCADDKHARRALVGSCTVCVGAWFLMGAKPPRDYFTCRLYVVRVMAA